MDNDPRNIMPGDRVKVFDSRLFKDDITTPLSITEKLATVVCRYGCKSEAIDSKRYDYNLCKWYIEYWYYPDLVDVIFDHRPELVSHGHFTNGVEVMEGV